MSDEARDARGGRPEGDARGERAALDRERRELVQRVEEWLETPMLVLGFVWLGLLVAELVSGLSPLLEGVGTVIWLVFSAEFTLRLAVSPERAEFVKRNWLTALSLLVPALRLFRLARLARLLRAARTTRGLRLFRVVSSLNRGMRALGGSMGRRGFGYVVGVTGIVLAGGAAGTHAFEKEAGGLGTYEEALGWTTMLLTTLGSEYRPRTGEGRLLCVLLALYAFAVFGYITATLATYFVGQEAGSRGSELAGASEVRALREEVAALRAALRTGGGAR